MEKIDSLPPEVGITWVEGSTSTPKRRITYPAIASRSSGSPAVVGYCEIVGHRILDRLDDEGAVGSRGSPIEKSTICRPSRTHLPGQFLEAADRILTQRRQEKG